jgi:hypothetical protein
MAASPVPMNRQKRVFIIVAVLFTVLMVYLGYDMAKRTTRPGHKKQLPERIRQY